MEGYVQTHQQYTESYGECRQWLVELMDQLTATAEPSGDRISIQNKLKFVKVRHFENTFNKYYISSNVEINCQLLL